MLIQQNEQAPGCMWPFGQSPAPIHCPQSVTPMDMFNGNHYTGWRHDVPGPKTDTERAMQREECKKKTTETKQDRNYRKGRQQGEIKSGKEEPLTAVCILTQNNCF